MESGGNDDGKQVRFEPFEHRLREDKSFDGCYHRGIEEFNFELSVHIQEFGKIFKLTLKQSKPRCQSSDLNYSPS